jgi:NADP-dependent aldehyde dehydrogenase
LRKAGAELLAGGENLPGPGYRHANTLLRINGEAFLSSPERFLQEAFGNETMAVVVDNEQEMVSVLEHLEGNLTASVYSSTTGGDDALYGRVAPLLRRRSGRFLNDKMPTGVAVSAAMNHGGPFPATGHPGFTAVGLPTSIIRFAALQCYDNVREERLPAVLRGE